jgi:Tol biopolymer transport system component
VSSAGATQAATLHRAVALTVGIGALALAVAAYLWWPSRTAKPPSTSATSPLQDLQITQLTTSGNAARPVLSPDGRYAAYVKSGDDFEHGGSVWIRQVAGSSDVQIVAPEPTVFLWGLTITPDGTFVDYVRGQGPRMELWRVSFLGGTPKKILDEVSTPVGWSPDGRHMAFVRPGGPGSGFFELMIADADGGNPRLLATRRFPAMFHSLAEVGRPVTRPAWSPDGRLIALAGSLRSPALVQQLVILDSGAEGERAIAVAGTISGVEWLDADSLLISQAVDGGPSQLWHVASGQGTVTRLTNDLSSYQGVSLDASRNSVVTQRAERRITVLTTDGTGNNPKEIVASAPSSGGTDYVGWAADRVLFTSTMAGHRAISILPAQGGLPQELAPFGSASAPKATSDGRTVVFGSLDSSHPGLWKITDAGRPVQLTKETAFQIAVAKGDRDVIFASQSTTPVSAWTISIDGGTPRQITARAFSGMALSPDGQTLAFVSRDDHGSRVYVMCDLPACSSPRTVPVAPLIVLVAVQWTADGAALSYVTGTPANIWVQPLDGKPPRQLTHFTDERPVADFAWSHDGKHLAIARTTTSNDIVLFKGLKR